MTAAELTLFRKSGGPLTKAIYLTPDGKVRSDARACKLVSGSARRVPIQSATALTDLIAALKSDEALTLGRLREGLADNVRVVTKNKLNGAAAPDIIARTAEFVCYAPNQPAFALVDFDQKGIPQRIAARIEQLGGLWPALVSVVPQLANSARVTRASTSAGLYRTDTGEQLPGSGGAHIYINVANGQDIDRFLRDLHDRSWLAGLGWLIVGAAGQLLDRSIVDRVVGSPERLVFEGAPVLTPPLAQDAESRQPTTEEGELLDTLAACPPITVVEKASLDRLKAVERNGLAPEAAKARAEFIDKHSDRLAEQVGISPADARRVLERAADRVLHPAIPLLFDDPELEGATVADILADPDRYLDETLANPLEGREYGTGKAKVMRRAGGSVWIHSFAHGGACYELKLNFASLETALKGAPAEPKAELAALFVRLVMMADVTPAEVEDLRNLVNERAGMGKRVLDRMLKAALAAVAARRKQEERDLRVAQRRDPRPEIRAPSPDDPWIPQMTVLNEVLSKSTWLEPPARNLDAVVTRVWSRRAAGFHELTSAGTNQEEPEDSRLPAPEQPLLTPLEEPELAELIEAHIDYIVDTGEIVRSVHLATPFVRHYRIRKFDAALPLMRSITTLPMVLPNGELLAGRGLDKRCGIVFRIPEQLLKLLPAVDQCTEGAVARAMSCLTDQWLVDVATGYIGKCTIITKAATIVERHLLAERPGFITTAGQRGTGKTVEQHMVSAAVLGHRATAAAWAFDDNERRKALLAYLATGIAFIVWDNIPRGATLACPHLERALTTETYSDRVLGESRELTVPATTVHGLTGNNIAARGDLASRLLEIRLVADRPDPENREFKHPDPIGWTNANRGKILVALYTILLGNPRLRQPKPTPAKTRFKAWYHVVGSAIEYAAKAHSDYVAALTMAANPKCKPELIDFDTLFLSGETGDEQSTSVASVLSTIAGLWPNGCTAQQVGRRLAEQITTGTMQNFVAALELASGKPFKTVITAPAISWRLRAIKDQPTVVDNKVLVLREFPDHQGASFRVETIR